MNLRAVAATTASSTHLLSLTITPFLNSSKFLFLQKSNSSSSSKSRLLHQYHHHRRLQLVPVPVTMSAGACIHQYGLLPSISSSLYSISSLPGPGAVHMAAASQGTVFHNAGAAALVSAGAYCLVLFFDNLTQRNLIKQKLSRKVVHILSGLLFMLAWPFFSTSTDARYFAAFVPLLNCLRLVIYGLSLASDEGLVKSVTREGNPRELLGGPLYYVLVLITSAVLFWRESPVGVIAVSMMCGGDGFADIIGRRFGSLKIPYNQHKSIAGSIAMFVFGFLSALVMLYYFSALDFIQLDWSSAVERVALVALVATIVESLPTTEFIDDNISVPLSSMLMATMLFT